jgi:hypothetical protein
MNVLCFSLSTSSTSRVNFFWLSQSLRRERQWIDRGELGGAAAPGKGSAKQKAAGIFALRLARVRKFMAMKSYPSPGERS